MQEISPSPRVSWLLGQPYDKVPFKDLSTSYNHFLFIWLSECTMALLTILSPSKWQLRTPTCRWKSALDFERFWSPWAWVDDLSFPMKAVIFNKGYLGRVLQLGMMYFQRFLEPPLAISWLMLSCCWAAHTPIMTRAPPNYDSWYPLASLPKKVQHV